jgi:AbrB family looped-hinge helix DNA binding protein
MNIMAYTAKITSKGQVTIPKAVREALKGDVVEFQVAKGQVILKAVKSVGGALRAYSKETKAFSEIREKVWGEVVDEKTKR